MAKRLLDVVFAGVLLVALAPLLIVLFLGVRASSPGPGLFRQERIGRNGRPFTILKFRSMHADAERRLVEDPDLRRRYLNGGYKLPLDADPRITKLGGFLRRTSFDELPQLWNVLKGEMSLVGPRPVLREELSEYGRYVGAYLVAWPGLTGPWQVAGRDAVRFPLRGRFDADYVDDWSLVADIKILLRTIPSAIRARGVQ
ncbi:MAG: sugar transferase [Acidimicrobiia bacterium]|nr:sugar transferase [Acidimicrobiia bacterium]